MEDNGPLFTRHRTRATLDPGGFAGPEPRPGLGAAVDVGAGVGRVMQDFEDAGVRQIAPDQFAIVALAPQAGGEAEVLGRELLDDRQGRAALLE